MTLLQWRTARPSVAISASLALLTAAGCHTDMWQQNKIQKPYQQSEFFANGQSARPLPAHTVAQGHMKANDPVYNTGILGGTRVNVEIGSGTPVETGIFRGKYTNQFPFCITRADLARGRDRFDIYCSPCHGRLGDGQGMVALRGMNLRRPPANYHTNQIKKLPVGQIYDVITNGYGIMYSYAERIPDPADRWRIVAWVKALQFSQYAPVSTLSEIDKMKLNQLQNGAARQ